MTHYGWKWPKPLLTDILNSGSAILSSTYRNLLIPLIPYEPYPVTIRIGTLFYHGADNCSFPRWKEHEKILQDYKLLIYPRLGFDISIPAIYPNVKKVDAPLMEISSTFIRNAYQADKDIRFFLPEGVRPYYYKI